MISATKKILLDYKKILPVILVVVVLSVAVFGPIAASQAYAFVTADTSSAGAVSSTAGAVAGAVGGAIQSIAVGAINSVLAFVSYTIMGVVVVILTISGFILDLSIKYSLTNFAQLASNTGMVGIGWGVIRDLANLVFIFLILWVAISTILGLGAGTPMKSVLRIVIAAVLINFSLFITKAVIDVANIIALHFYYLTVPPDQGGSLSAVFMQALNPQSIYPGGATPSFASGIETKILLASVFGSIVMLVASWVFIAAAVMFIIRTIYLMILMVLSPFAFIAWVVPGMSGTTHDWWKRLFNQAFFAPIILIMFYIIGYVIQHGGLFSVDPNSPKTLSDALTAFTPGDTVNVAGAASSAATVAPGLVGIFFNYLMLLGMIIASLIVANKLGAVGATTMMNWGNGIRNAGQGLVGRSLMRANIRGVGIRSLDEKFRDSASGKTAIGRKIREYTTGYLADKAKFGGSMTAEEAHTQALKEESERIDTKRSNDAMVFAEELRGGITTHDQKIEAKDQEVNGAKKEREAAEASGDKARTDKSVQNVDKLENELKELQDEKESFVRTKDSDIQRVLAPISSRAFAHDLAKKVYADPDVMRNATISQVKAVQEGERLSEKEKDQSLEARYNHIIRALEKLDRKGGAREAFNDEMKEYIQTAGQYWGDVEKSLNEIVTIDGKRDTRGNHYGYDIDELKNDKVKLRQFKIAIVNEKNQQT